MQRIVTDDSGNRRGAAAISAATLTKTASYTITQADMRAAGGHLHVNVSSAAAAVDISLPSAVANKGSFITLFKPSGNTNAVSFLATGGQTVEGSTAGKRFQNLTNELGVCTIWSDGANWRVSNLKGTWVVNNT